jgi:hypothetical protein
MVDFLHKEYEGDVRRFSSVIVVWAEVWGSDSFFTYATIEQHKCMPACLYGPMIQHTNANNLIVADLTAAINTALNYFDQKSLQDSELSNNLLPKLISGTHSHLASSIPTIRRLGMVRSWHYNEIATW